MQDEHQGQSLRWPRAGPAGSVATSSWLGNVKSFRVILCTSCVSCCGDSGFCYVPPESVHVFILAGSQAGWIKKREVSWTAAQVRSVPSRSTDPPCLPHHIGPWFLQNQFIHKTGVSPDQEVRVSLCTFVVPRGSDPDLFWGERHTHKKLSPGLSLLPNVTSRPEPACLLHSSKFPGRSLVHSFLPLLLFCIFCRWDSCPLCEGGPGRHRLGHGTGGTPA